MGNNHQAEQIHVLKQTECKTHPELSMIAQEEIISHSGHKKFGNQTQIQRRVFTIKLYLVSMPEDLLYMNALIKALQCFNMLRVCHQISVLTLLF